MRRKILYCMNPISGTGSKAPVKELIIHATEAEGIEYAIIATNREGDYAFLREKISAEQITDIVIAGGDGTVSQVVASLMGVDVRIGIIPLGSGNGLAFAAKIPKEPAKALSVVFHGTDSWVDGFYINEQFSCMLCGLGFDAQVAHDFAKEKKRGLITYVKLCIKNYLIASIYPFEIITGNQQIQADAYFVSIANSNQFGNQFTIAPHASLNDGLLDIVVVKKMNKFILLLSILRQIMGKNSLEDVNEKLKPKNIRYFQSGELTIHNTSLAPLHIDGEPAETSASFKVKIIPNCFRLIQPR
jgi:diacylglycerol kinase (ATP)